MCRKPWLWFPVLRTKIENVQQDPNREIPPHIRNLSMTDVSFDKNQRISQIFKPVDVHGKEKFVRCGECPVSRPVEYCSLYTDSPSRGRTKGNEGAEYTPTPLKPSAASQPWLPFTRIADRWEQALVQVLGQGMVVRPRGGRGAVQGRPSI